MKLNTLNHKEFLKINFFWAIIVYLLYRKLLFIKIRNLSLFHSDIILFGLIVVFVIVNLILSIGWCRNKKSIITTLLVPLGIFTIIAYNQYLGQTFNVILYITGVIMLIFLVSIITKKNDNPFGKQSKMKIKLKKGYVGMRRVTAYTSATIIITVFVSTNFMGGILSSNAEKFFDYSEQYTIAANMDIVLKLQDKIWNELSLDEKLYVMQTIVNIEGNYLGLDKPVHLYAVDLDEGVLGFYNAKLASIQIDTKHFNNSPVEKVLNTVCHESYHAAQYMFVDIYNNLEENQKNLYFFWNAQTYSEEFLNYVNGEDNYYHYYSQKCERDARNYAVDAVIDYYDRIHAYNNNLEDSKKSGED